MYKAEMCESMLASLLPGKKGNISTQGLGPRAGQVLMNFGNTDFANHHISIQDAVQRQEEKKGIPPGQIQNFSYAATMNKIKETKNANEFAGKERERRQRKMQVDQRRIQETLDE